MISGESLTLTSRGIEETAAFGARLGAALAGGEVIGLIGPLGAGKTHLTKGIAAGAGFMESGKVTSPTFVLINEYPGRVYIRHIDAYRLGSVREFQALGFDEMLESGGAVIIEWADRVAAAMPDDWLEIRFRVDGPSNRTMICTAHGAASRRIVSMLRS